MRKLKTALMAMVATLAVVFGGLVAAAPAQAVWGTTVTVTSANGNSWIRTTNMVGTDKLIHLGETARNVRTFEPPSDGWSMAVHGPNGSVRWLQPGEGYTPTNDGVYEVWIVRE